MPVAPWPSRWGNARDLVAGPTVGVPAWALGHYAVIPVDDDGLHLAAHHGADAGGEVTQAELRFIVAVRLRELSMPFSELELSLTGPSSGMFLLRLGCSPSRKGDSRSGAVFCLVSPIRWLLRVWLDSFTHDGADSGAFSCVSARSSCPLALLSSMRARLGSCDT